MLPIMVLNRSPHEAIYDEAETSPIEAIYDQPDEARCEPLVMITFFSVCDDQFIL